MEFVTSFLRALLDAITSTIRADKWQEVNASPDTVKLLMAVISDAKMYTPSASDRDKLSFIIGEEAFRSVACGSRLIRSDA